MVSLRSRRCRPAPAGRRSPHNVTSVAPCSSALSNALCAPVKSRSNRSGGHRNRLRMGTVLPRRQDGSRSRTCAPRISRAERPRRPDQTVTSPSGHYPVVDPSRLRTSPRRARWAPPRPVGYLMSSSSAPTRDPVTRVALNTSVSGIEGSSNHRVLHSVDEGEYFHGLAGHVEIGGTEFSVALSALMSW